MEPTYVCPKTRKKLEITATGLLRNDGMIYPFITSKHKESIPNFLTPWEHGDLENQSLSMYDQKDSTEVYHNFLDWLFKTFNEDERSFRLKLINKLRLSKGNKILITACGLGDDIRPILELFGSDIEIYANDLSAEMVLSASQQIVTNQKNVFFSVCNAQYLPFGDDFFDAAFHFGGINLFDNIKMSVGEMSRVVKPGGRVVFGDEGIGPWLKETDYGRIAINNNKLWAYPAPIDLLPTNCEEVNLTWVLGNCFYVIDFVVLEKEPFIDMDIPHVGRRGGSMRTRYFGQLEGVTERTKQFVLEDAKNKGMSVHDWLEHVINEKQKS